MSVSKSDASDTRLFRFAITDEDGIHQAQLFVPIEFGRKKFHDCKTLNGKEKATFVFEITDPKIENVELRMIDMHGNIAQREFIIDKKRSETSKEP